MLELIRNYFFCRLALGHPTQPLKVYWNTCIYDSKKFSELFQLPITECQNARQKFIKKH